MTYDSSRINIVVVLVVAVFCFEFTVVVLGVVRFPLRPKGLYKVSRCSTIRIIPWLSFSVPGVLSLAAITLTTFMGLYCYLLCVLSDSGKVPDDYQHDPEDHVTFQVQVKRKGGTARWCSKCNKPKPPRTHHCRVCERCVARMDHHCPWINNCVGHGNYKAFLLCLFYTESALLLAMALFSMHALHLMAAKSSSRVVRIGPEGLPTTLSNISRFDDGAKHFMLWAVLQTAGLALTFPLAIGIGVLLGWHVYIVSSNKTTIEYHEGVTASAQFRAFGQRYDHPYNIGLLNNINAVLGQNALCWLLPGISAAGDGIVFPTNLVGLTSGSMLTKTRSTMS